MVYRWWRMATMQSSRRFGLPITMLRLRQSRTLILLSVTGLLITCLYVIQLQQQQQQRSLTGSNNVESKSHISVIKRFDASLVFQYFLQFLLYQRSYSCCYTGTFYRLQFCFSVFYRGLRLEASISFGLDS